MSSNMKELQFSAEHPSPSASDADQQTATEETLISSQNHSQHSTEHCSLALSQCDSKPRGKVGRPLKYDGDINNPDLDDADRRKLRRRTANRLSARRVRDRRASMASELEAKMNQTAVENAALRKRVAKSETECRNGKELITAVQRKLSEFRSQNQYLQGRVLNLEQSLTQVDTGDTNFASDIWMADSGFPLGESQVSSAPISSSSFTQLGAATAAEQHCPAYTYNLGAAVQFKQLLPFASSSAAWWQTTPSHMKQQQPLGNVSIPQLSAPSLRLLDQSPGCSKDQRSVALTSGIQPKADTDLDAGLQFPDAPSQPWLDANSMPRNASFNLSNDMSAILDTYY